MNGRIEHHRIQSEVLAGNPLGDPTERDLLVYMPPGYHDSDTTLPVLLALAGFTGTGANFFDSDSLGESLDRRLDRLIDEGRCPPVLVVAPDCFTRLGGSQYVNSTATGRYEDHLVNEVVPFVADRYRCGRWGVFGKSSGGYGALVLAMRHPEIFRALGDHSGDAGFEMCYLPDMAAALEAFREAGGPVKWLSEFWRDVNRRRKKYMKPLDMLAMAAAYSPNPDSPHLGIDFPFDLDTGAFRPEVWERWRENDPVNMVARHADDLVKLRAIYVDCGTKDEFGLQWGTRALVAEMKRAGLRPAYEEFDDGHFSISYRFDTGIPTVAKALRGD